MGCHINIHQEVKTETKSGRMCMTSAMTRGFTVDLILSIEINEIAEKNIYEISCRIIIRKISIYFTEMTEF